MNTALTFLLLALPTAEPPKSLSTDFHGVLIPVERTDPLGQISLGTGLGAVEGMPAFTTAFEDKDPADEQPAPKKTGVFSREFQRLCHHKWLSRDGGFSFQGWLASLAPDGQTVTLANETKTVSVPLNQLHPASQARIRKIVTFYDFMILSANSVSLKHGRKVLVPPKPFSRLTLLQKHLLELRRVNVSYAIEVDPISLRRLSPELGRSISLYFPGAGNRNEGGIFGGAGVIKGDDEKGEIDEKEDLNFAPSETYTNGTLLVGFLPPQRFSSFGGADFEEQDMLESDASHRQRLKAEFEHRLLLPTSGIGGNIFTYSPVGLNRDDHNQLKAWLTNIGALDGIRHPKSASARLVGISADNTTIIFYNAQQTRLHQPLVEMTEKDRKIVSSAILARTALTAWVNKTETQIEELLKNPPKPQFTMMKKYHFGQTEKEVRAASGGMKLSVLNKATKTLLQAQLPAAAVLRHPPAGSTSLYGQRLIAGKNYFITFTFFQDALYQIAQGHMAKPEGPDATTEEKSHQSTVLKALQDKYGKTYTLLAAGGAVAEWTEPVAIGFYSSNLPADNLYSHRVVYAWPLLKEKALSAAGSLFQKEAKKLKDDF